MMKNLLISFLLTCLVTSPAISQIIVDKGIYKANFSNKFHQPRYVSYYLYKGGGSCDRKKFTFKNDMQELECATDEDYAGSKYDKGHLANAEDFAFDCTKDELTFRYYNCLPQTVNLNRGPWKTNETKVRDWSKKEKLYIICGGYFTSKKHKNMSIPDYCWKVVQSSKTKQVLYCGWFSNISKATVEEITITELEKKLKTKIILLK